MARIFNDNAGKVIAVSPYVWSDDDPAPQGSAGSVQYDETTNRNLASTVINAMAEFTVVGGVLQRNGSPVTIAADSQTKQTLDALIQGAQQAVQNNQTAIANDQAFIGLASPTQAQTLAYVKQLAQQDIQKSQQINQIIKRLLLLGRSLAN